MSGPHCTAPTLEKKLSIASKNDRNESPRLASSSTGGQPHQGLVGRGRVGQARPAPVAVLPAARVDAMASHERRQYLALPAPWGFLTTVLSRAAQSGTKRASARASERRPATTRSSTSSAYTSAATASAISRLRMTRRLGSGGARLLEETREAAVLQDAPARLLLRAIRHDVVLEVHGLEGGAAARAGLALLAMHLQGHRRLVGQRLADDLLVVH